jgi:hypothetical protein
MICDHYSVAHGIPKVIDLMSEIAEQSSAKRKVEAKLAASMDLLQLVRSWWILTGIVPSQETLSP